VLCFICNMSVVYIACTINQCFQLDCSKTSQTSRINHLSVRILDYVVMVWHFPNCPIQTPLFRAYVAASPGDIF
jgi:hypothetical protein